MGRTLWSAVATGANAAFVFALIPIVTKLGGLRTYGLWEAFAVLVALVAPVAWMGLRSGFTRYSAGIEDRRTLSANFHAVLLVVVPAALALGALEGLASPLLAREFFSADPLAYPLLRIAAGLVAVESIRMIVMEFYRATLRIRALGVLEACQRSAELTVITVVLWRGGTVVGCATGVLAVRIVAVAVAYTGAVRAVGWERPDFSRLLPYMTFGLPLLTNEFLGRVLKVADRFVIGRYWTMDDVGLYAVPANLAMVFTLYTSTLQVWMYPHLSGLWNQGKKQEAVDTLSRALRFYTLLALPTLAGLTALGPLAISMVADPQTAVQTVAILPLVGAGLMLYGVAALTLYALTLVERTAMISVLLCGTVAVNLTLNVALVPRLGITGAGVAHVTGFALLALVMGLLVKRFLRLEVFTPWQLPRALLCCVAMAAAVWAVGTVTSGLPCLIVSVVVGAGVYGGGLLWTRCVTIAEVRALLGRRAIED